MDRAGEHPREALHELLDERLAVSERAEVEAHLAACESCLRELELLRHTRTALRRGGAGGALRDPQLEARLRRALDDEDAAAGGRRDPQLRAAAWIAVATAAALALIAVWAWTAGPRPPDLPAAAMAELAALRDGDRSVQVASEDPAVVERAFASGGVAFRARVLDLGMMGWRLVGGSVIEIDGRPTALSVYRDARGRLLVCQMSARGAGELPPGAERFEKEGISFFVYQRDGMTAVFWPEGEVLCVLVSDLPPAEVRELAVAKAMRAA